MLKGDIRVMCEWTSEGDRKPFRRVAVNGNSAPVINAGLYDRTRERVFTNLGGTAGLVYFLSLDLFKGQFFY